MPLTNEQLAEIKSGVDNAEKALRDAIADMALAKRAGIDVTVMEKDLTALRTQIRKLKAVYY